MIALKLIDIGMIALNLRDTRLIALNLMNTEMIALNLMDLGMLALKLVYEIIHEDNDNPVGDIDLREFIAVLRLDFCDPDIQISGLSLFRNGRIDKNRQLSFSCGLLVAFENFTLY